MNGAKNTQVTVSGSSRLDRTQTRAGWVAGFLRPRVKFIPERPELACPDGLCHYIYDL